MLELTAKMLGNSLKATHSCCPLSSRMPHGRPTDTSWIPHGRPTDTAWMPHRRLMDAP